MRPKLFEFLALSLYAVAPNAQESFPVIATLELGEAPHQISFDATGRTAYVAAAGSDWVAVVDVESLRITKKLAVAETPLGVIPGRADGIVRIREEDGATLGELTTGGAPPLFAPLPEEKWMVSVEKANRSHSRESSYSTLKPSVICRRTTARNSRKSESKLWPNR